MTEASQVTKKKSRLTRLTSSQVVHRGQSISGTSFSSSRRQMIYETVEWIKWLGFGSIFFESALDFHGGDGGTG